MASLSTAVCRWGLGGPRPLTPPWSGAWGVTRTETSLHPLHHRSPPGAASLCDKPGQISTAETWFWLSPSLETEVSSQMRCHMCPAMASQASCVQRSFQKDVCPSPAWSRAA
ncbi:hypothetical protein CapIbe_016080 [Capra ibex]